MNYLYIIIFSFVPRKAVLGRSQVAVTLLAVSFFFIFGSVSLWIEYYMKIRLLNIYSVFITFGVLFISFRWYFLNQGRLKKNLKKYEGSTKWVLRLIGIVFFILSFFSQIITGIVITILNNN
ncbi:MAG: hypothetical protein H0S84_05455 [Bacteroidales bacterium]|jgi:hypothetical protein|nr:hypothetical protein [Bacteroidales bacterium]